LKCDKLRIETLNVGKKFNKYEIKEFIYMFYIYAYIILGGLG